MNLTTQSVAILGAGNMGGALVGGLVRGQEAVSIIATVRDASRRQDLLVEGRVELSEDNALAVARSEVVVLCVKPYALEELAGTLRGTLTSQHLLVSILAGVTTAKLAKLLDFGGPIVRAMPNIPARVEAAATAIAGGAGVETESMDVVEAMFRTVGEVVRVPERLMDAVTGLSGSGPAYIYMVIEALTDGGVQMGIPRETALKLATQTVLGSARLVKETGLHPAILRDQVTTPGGTTISATYELERHGLRAMLASAVVTATERSRDLNDE